MRRSIFKAGVWTALGLAIAFAVVSANSNTRRAVTTAAPAAEATVASTNATADDCTPSDICCAKETEVNAAAVAVAPRAKNAATPAVTGTGAAGMVIAIDPETGELGMPNAEQLRDLRGTQQPQSTAPATVVHFPNGALGSPVELEPEYATIHIDANGKKVFSHSDNATPNPAPATPALEEK